MSKLSFRGITVVALVLVALVPLAAQVTPTTVDQQAKPPVAQPPQAPGPQTEGPPSSEAPPSGQSAPAQPGPGVGSAAAQAPVKLLIGPGDEGDMTVYGVPEMNTHFRVSATGDIYLPLIDKVHVAGLTADAVQVLLEQKYIDGGFLRNPHISIFIKEYTTQGISVLGEVQKPGIYSALNARRLYDLFLIAGGLTQRAGKTVTIKHANSADKPQVVAISYDLGQSSDANVELLPGDTVVISRAGLVYVIGEINRPGGYVIESASDMTMLQVLAMAAGPTRLASLNHTKVLRKTAKGIEMKEVDAKRLMQAKLDDVPLQSDDIVYIPPSRGKMAMERSTNSILGMLTNLAVYRF